MIELLRYYYYIIIDRISYKNNNYYFKYQNNYFCFYKYKRNLDEINEIYNLNNYMLFNNIKINKIILNNKQEILTFYKNNYYCLVLLNIFDNSIVDINKVLEFNRFKTNLNLLKRSLIFLIL